MCAICVGAPGVAVALNVVESAPAVAVTALGPVAVPSVQLPSVARPAASVVCVAPVTPPPPAATANVTLAAATGLPNWSVRRTRGAVPTAVLTTLACKSPDTLTICVAPAAVAVALKTTGVTPDNVAVRLLPPTVVPRVQLPTVARPAEFESCAAPVTLPPPPLTLNVIDAPATGFPNWSCARTAGSVATALPTTALWRSPAVPASSVAGPATPVAVNARVSPAPVAVSEFVPASVPSVQLPTVAKP